MYWSPSRIKRMSERTSEFQLLGMGETVAFNKKNNEREKIAWKKRKFEKTFFPKYFYNCKGE